MMDGEGRETKGVAEEGNISSGWAVFSYGHVENSEDSTRGKRLKLQGVTWWGTKKVAGSTEDLLDRGNQIGQRVTC